MKLEWKKKDDFHLLTAEEAEYINHNYGNIKDNGCIKQYIFYEGEPRIEVIDFFKHFYPEVWEEFLDS